MRKYLAIFAIVFLAAILTNYEHERYSNRAAAYRRAKCGFVFLDCTPNGKGYVEEPKGTAEIWWERFYIFFGWPNGTTIWSLVITFAVIAEQTMETRKAAQSSQKQIAFQKEALRPRLSIANLRMTLSMKLVWVNGFL